MQLVLLIRMLQRRYENLTDAFHGRADVQLVLLVQKASHHRIFNLSVPEELGWLGRSYIYTHLTEMCLIPWPRSGVDDTPGVGTSPSDRAGVTKPYSSCN